MPALTPSLRGLFGGGMECCLEQCREELIAIAGREEGGVASQTIFRTAATSTGGSVASGLRSIVSGKLKARLHEVMLLMVSYPNLLSAHKSPLRNHIFVKTQTWRGTEQRWSIESVLFCFLFF